jgi:hypothetical protein
MDFIEARTFPLHLFGCTILTGTMFLLQEFEGLPDLDSYGASDHHPNLPSDLGVIMSQEKMEGFRAAFWCVFLFTLKPTVRALTHSHELVETSSVLLWYG